MPSPNPWKKRCWDAACIKPTWSYQYRFREASKSRGKVVTISTADWVKQRVLHRWELAQSPSLYHLAASSFLLHSFLCSTRRCKSLPAQVKQIIRDLLKSLNLAVLPIKGLYLQLWLTTDRGSFSGASLFCLCAFLLSRAKWLPLYLAEVLCSTEEQHPEVSPKTAFIHAVLLLTEGSCVHRSCF